MSVNFTGFGKTIEYLKKLEQNNNREWFQAHKDEYQTDYLEPAQAFVGAFGEKLHTISPGINADPKLSGGSLMRIYRDVRFSKDKTPYNPRLRAMFWEGPGKKTEEPGFFFGMHQDSALIYGGRHNFPKEYLPIFRQVVDDPAKADEFNGLLNSLRKVNGYEVDGEQYKKVPREYDPGHPDGDLLRYKGIFIKSPEIDAQTLRSPSLVDACYEICKVMAPLHHWLVKAAKF